MSKPCKKIVFVINIENLYGGLFAIFREILEGLYFCDYYGQVAVIRITDSSLYKDQSNNEVDNVFNYYFNQPCNKEI